jgi:hypothetical protein
MRMSGPLLRGLAASTALAAAGLMVAEAVRDSPPFGVAFNLLLVLTAAWLWQYGGRGHLVSAATAAGIAACLAWAAAFAFGWWNTEPVYIAFSALWWLGLGYGLWRRGQRWYGGLTFALGLAAVGDVLAGVSGLSGAAFALVGGWKLPLQLLWTVVTGAVAAWRQAPATGELPAAGSRSGG